MTTTKKVDGFMEQIFNAAIDEKLTETQVRARCAALSIRARATMAEAALGKAQTRNFIETSKEVRA